VLDQRCGAGEHLGEISTCGAVSGLGHVLCDRPATRVLEHGSPRRPGPVFADVGVKWLWNAIPFEGAA